MDSTRRALFKAGIAGIVASHAPLALGKPFDNKSFNVWRDGFEAKMIKRMDAAKVVGASVAIVSRQSTVSYVKSFGFADLGQNRKLTVGTPMHLASVSKLFTAAALVQLFDRNHLELHGDVNSFIEFPVVNPNFPGTKITPHQLLTHTSTISDEGYGAVSSEGDPTQSISDFLKSYLVEGGSSFSAKHSFDNAKPGTKWNYSNVAIALAGQVIESVSKTGFSDYVERHILHPLRINNAHWYLRDFPPDVLAKPYEFDRRRFVELPQQGYPDVPSGMLRCSIADLARFIGAMLGSISRPDDFLSEKLTAEMLNRQVSRRLIGYQGLGWVQEEINGRQFIGHSGRDTGASNMVIVTTDQTQAVMMLMNIEPTDETDRFRAATIEDLLTGATFAVN